ncbi:MAG TPA: hypothetical protein VGY53_00160, partial [Isosphaeraceae bacterium]|nr:hypothetical protein [Isosphaeraceae bacterium]
LAEKCLETGGMILIPRTARVNQADSPGLVVLGLRASVTGLRLRLTSWDSAVIDDRCDEPIKRN